MARDIAMPALSPTMEEGTLLKWHVKEGDQISAGDVIAEIETDKATMEVEAVDDGVITEILVAEGTENVKVHSAIARFQGDDEDPAETSAPKQQAPQPAAAPEPPAAPAVESAPAAPAPTPVPTASSGGQRIASSPLARRIAAELNIDITTVTGTGPRGRIVKADVEAAVADKTPAAAPAEAASVAPEPARAPTSDSAVTVAADNMPPYEDIRLSGMRKTIARRLTQSKQEIPHYYLTVDVQLDALMKLRSTLNQTLESQRIRLSVNDFLIKALALALMRVPEANVSYTGDHLRQYSRADISVAVAIPGGLITPVIRNADGKRLSQISTDMRDLGARAKDGKLRPEEYTGGTASISNLGMFGVREFSAVINPPEAMILAVSAAEKRPVVIDDELQIATMMCATGSFDHRAIDGAVGAKLLSALKDLVENPLAMLA